MSRSHRNMQSKPKDFLQLKDSLFSSAGLLWGVGVAANVAAFALALVALAVPADGGWSVCLGLLALLLPAASVVLREWAAVPADRAAKINQLVLFADSFDQPIPAAEQAKVRRWVPKEALMEAPYVAPYFSSKLPPGAARIADNLAESAYFTEHIAESAAKWVAVTLAAILGLMVIAGYVAGNATVASKTLSAFARGIVMTIPFVVTGDFAVLLWRYIRLKLSAACAYTAACGLRDDNAVSLEDVLPVLHEYNSARVQGPPLPRWLHVRHMEELNADYRASHDRE
jgi:hypothetical protein